MSIEVFISYDSVDEKFAENISGMLTELGIKYFKNTIRLGQKWIDEVNGALSRSTEFIVIVSPAGLASQWVNYEVGYADGLEKTILSFLTHPSFELPEYLSTRQHTHSIDKLKEYFADKLREI